MMLVAALLSFNARAYTQFGDVNGDGVVNISDVNCVISDILMFGFNADSDVNADGAVNISDVNVVVGLILGDNKPITQKYTVKGVTFKMVTVAGGTFTMGATQEHESVALSNEKPVHEVTLSTFCIGETEVTQALWQAVMGSNPSNFTGDLSCPVEKVSWNDCQDFITKLNQLTGKTFRLPTEAEWEFAARGGIKSNSYIFAGSNAIKDVAWYDGNGNSTTHAVASLAPNELGLYDMSGNVWEWCQDWYGAYKSSAQTDPTGPSYGAVRVIRGGCYINGDRFCRVTSRVSDAPVPSGSGKNIGLRLAL